jgi:hypothetical protein
LTTGEKYLCLHFGLPIVPITYLIVRLGTCPKNLVCGGKKMKKVTGGFLFIGWSFVLLGLLLSLAGTQAANPLALVAWCGVGLFGLSAVIFFIFTVATTVALRANSANEVNDPTKHHYL